MHPWNQGGSDLVVGLGDDRSAYGDRRPAVVAVAAAVLLLVLSFASYYRYGQGPALQPLCRARGAGCARIVLTRDAWHGFFGGLAVVAGVLSGMCALVSLRSGMLQLALACAALFLDVVAMASLITAITVVPRLGGATHDLAQALRVSYVELVTSHRAWALWMSLAVVLLEQDALLCNC